MAAFFLPLEQCIGCGACLSTCPKAAISMGCSPFFYKPSIDEAKCIKCNRCQQVCPAFGYSSPNKERDLRSFAISASDEERMQSSSGAVFPLLAKAVLRKGGFVCGAAWDESWNVHHIIIDNQEDLAKLRVSKYVQSFMGDCFAQIKKLLDYDKLVLFSGMPCQNAGLQKFLGKDYDNLITIDLLCHGAPSPKVWQDYLKANFDVDKITHITFRSKKSGWNCGTGAIVSFLTTDGGGGGMLKKYYPAFLGHKLSNEACLECPYKFIPRISDITLGDFWSYRSFDEKLSDDKGLSIALANSPKGLKLLLEIKDECKSFKEINLHKDWSYIEVNKKSRATAERELFFKDYAKISVNQSLDAANHEHYDVALLGMFSGCNYGSALVSYAAQEIIKGLGFSVVLIFKKREPTLVLDARNKSLAFARTHGHITRFYDYNEDVSDINQLVDAFVVGSDTNWMWEDVRATHHYYWLDFAQADKRKIAFSTSFAHDIPDIPQAQYPELKYLYSRFDAISCREATGITALKERFGVDATHLYDPTLIADKAIFEELAKESKRTDKNYLFAYILDLTPEKEAAVQAMARELNLPIRCISKMLYEGYSKIVTDKNIKIVDFVYLVKNATLVVTDSFHGTAFSVIFERPFVSFVNMWRGGARYQIFRDMGLSSALVNDVASVSLDPAKYVQSFDFSCAKAVLTREREKARDWLKNALFSPRKESAKEDLLYDYLYAQQFNRPYYETPLASRKRKIVTRLKAPLKKIKWLKKTVDYLRGYKIRSRVREKLRTFHWLRRLVNLWRH